MADKHAVVRTDKMAGTDVRSKMVSLMYVEKSEEAPAPADIDNGNVVIITPNLAEGREIYYAVAPTVKADLSMLALIATPEMIYENGKQDITNFYNEAGIPARGYRLTSGDIFSVTAEALDGADSSTKVSSVVELGDTTKLKVVESATEGSTKIGTIIDIETVGTHKYFVIEVA